jgi:diadenosine tetraphosphate (Ap4A) HIT family hydrolase
MTCPFCDRIAANAPSVASTDLVVAFPDAYPLNAGHTLIVPRRHVERLSDLRDEERRAVWDLVPIVKAWIDAAYAPHGYNIGINDGPVAGQTIDHVHLHVIPRYAGDTSDPRGGVRWVVPERAAYWKKDDE